VRRLEPVLEVGELAADDLQVGRHLPARMPSRTAIRLRQERLEPVRLRLDAAEEPRVVPVAGREEADAARVLALLVGEPPEELAAAGCAPKSSASAW